MTRAASSDSASASIDSAARALDHIAHLGGESTIASLSMPAPVVDAATLARAFAGELRFLWRDRHGALHGGIGVAARVVGSGRARFAQARDGVRQLYRSVAGAKHPLYGGFAFEPGSAHSETWAGFGDARFELPAVAYIADGERASLHVNIKNPLDPRARRAALAELERRGKLLLQAAASPVGETETTREAPSEGGRDHYIELVTRARDLVRSGAFEKIVVARSRTIELADAPDLAALLGRIDAAYRDCTLFSVAGDRGTLLAASPERLATVRGNKVETVALAGTVPIARADDLLSDAKLQLEHRVTALAIAAAMGSAPGIDDVDVAPAPRLYRLRNLVHLETPITARREAGMHIFDVAAALHPTPAVAGIPTAEACQFLADAEGMERGWYAGLVGWCNESGEGELAVALRAGLLCGKTMRLYAGAGIVGDSVPETEWEETALKLSALEARLGGPLP